MASGHALSSKESSRCADHPILTQEGSDKKRKRKSWQHINIRGEVKNHSSEFVLWDQVPWHQVPGDEFVRIACAFSNAKRGGLGSKETEWEARLLLNWRESWQHCCGG